MRLESKIIICRLVGPLPTAPGTLPSLGYPGPGPGPLCSVRPTRESDAGWCVTRASAWLLTIHKEYCDGVEYRIDWPGKKRCASLPKNDEFLCTQERS